MSDILDFFSKLVHKDAVRRTRLHIDPAHISPPGRSTTLAKAEEHYVRLWIVEMFLREENRWFTSRYPLVYSLASFTNGNETTDFANVSGKRKLDIQQTDIGRAILANYPLTPLIPFRGGTVSIDGGLVSLAADDVIKSFAGVVSDFAGMLAMPQISAGIGIAASVATSVQALLGAGAATTELYYHDTFTGNAGAGGGTPLASGLVFLSEKPEGTYDAGEIWIENGSPRLKWSDGTPRDWDAQSYMVIEIEVAATRDDFRQIAAIREPFEQALDAKLGGETDKADALLLVAIRAAIKSPDLTALDRKRVVAALRDGYAHDGWVIAGSEAAAETARAPGGAAKAPSRLERALARISVDAARALPDPAEEFADLTTS